TNMTRQYAPAPIRVLTPRPARKESLLAVHVAVSNEIMAPMASAAVRTLGSLWCLTSMTNKAMAHTQNQLNANARLRTGSSSLGCRVNSSANRLITSVTLANRCVQKTAIISCCGKPGVRNQTDDVG